MMEAFLTFAVIVAFLYMCLVIFAALQDWHSRRKLSHGPQSSDDVGE